MRERIGRARLVGTFKKLTLALDGDDHPGPGRGASLADSGPGPAPGLWPVRSVSASSSLSSDDSDDPDPRMSMLAPALAPAWLANAHSRRYVSRALDVLDRRDNIRQRAMIQSACRHRRRPSQSDLDGVCLPDDLVEYYAAADALAPENVSKNRYRDVLPFDRTRVAVPTPGDELAAPRYINADFVRELAGGKYWIAAQAALPFTAHALLSMLLLPVQTPAGPLAHVRTVVQLTRSVESGRIKAHPYFPETVGETHHIAAETAAAPIAISLLAQCHIADADAVVSTLRIAVPNGAPHVFNHMLYTAWPDHDVPADCASLVRFVRLVDRANRDPRAFHAAFAPAPLPLLSTRDPNAVPPAVVGCSAGVGRTGAFVAISSLLRANGLLDDHQPPLTPGAQPYKPPGLPASPLGPMDPVLQLDPVVCEVDSLREQRSHMVQTHSQLVFVYDAIASAIEHK